MITFKGGPLSEQVILESGDITAASSGWPQGGNDFITNGELLEALEVNGNWGCGSEGGEGISDGSLSVTMKPDQTVTFPMWVMAVDAINNNTPTFSAAGNPDWAFTGSTIVNQAGSSVTSAFGPHAMNCGNSFPEIGLFVTPPFGYTLNDGNGGTESESCSAA
jgi:hypothetical protein